MYVKTGIEAEFFLLTPEGDKISDEYDTATKPCYDQQAIMRRYDVIAEICDYMLELGWGPYQNDHEDANGQFEMNWEFDDVLATADKHSFFKFMTKSVAEKHGLKATLMPKPVEGLTGNGCHAHISVWDGKKNKFLQITCFDIFKTFYDIILRYWNWIWIQMTSICHDSISSFRNISFEF